MIISHRHRFIFIKNRKVGSTSTELALQKICGPEDVITPDHMHRSEADVLAPAARNWDGRFLPFRELAQARHPMDAARTLRDAFKRPKFYNHMRASSVKARIPAEIWRSYYKFCFERNPWDKAVSFYYWFGRSRELPDIDSFYQRHRDFGTQDQVFPSDWSRYTLHDRVIVDDVYDYADLAGGLRTALRKAGVAADLADGLELPKEKAGLRKQAEVSLAPETDRLIRQVFAREIATFPFCAEPQSGASATQ